MRAQILVLLAAFGAGGLERAARGGEAAVAIEVGVAETEITPPLGFPVAGYYHERRATATNDPLKAKAIVFRSGSELAALVVCDLTGIAFDLAVEVRRRAAAKTGIPADNIILSATHSHTAPDYGKDLHQYLADQKAGTVPEKAPYAAKLIDGIVEAVVRAHRQAGPVTLEYGAAHQQTPVSFNRRFVMEDGTVRTWMRLDQTGVVRPAGPIDPEIGLLLVRSAGAAKPLCLVSNFALHLDTVGGTQWSADYPFYIEQEMRRHLGAGMLSIFASGCCGDINHVDPVAVTRNKTDFIGRALAGSINGSLKGLKPITRPTLRIAREVVPVPLQDVSPADLTTARSLLMEAKSGKQVDFFPVVKAYKAVVLDQLRNKSPAVRPADHINWGLSHTWAGVGQRLPVEVHAIGLGNEMAIVCLPGEVFVDLGLAIKRASPFRTTLIVELSNCIETLYIPTRVAYAGGSYEVTNSTLQPGAGEALAEAAVRLLRSLAESSGGTATESR